VMMTLVLHEDDLKFCLSLISIILFTFIKTMILIILFFFEEKSP